MKNFHRFQNFRQFSNLFSQIRLKKRHTSLYSGICREIRTKFHQKFAEKMQNSTKKMKKIGNANLLGRLPPPFSFFGVSFSTGQSRSFRGASSTACARKKNVTEGTNINNTHPPSPPTRAGSEVCDSSDSQAAAQLS